MKFAKTWQIIHKNLQIFDKIGQNCQINARIRQNVAQQFFLILKEELFEHFQNVAQQSYLILRKII